MNAPFARAPSPAAIAYARMLIDRHMAIIATCGHDLRHCNPHTDPDGDHGHALERRIEQARAIIADQIDMLTGWNLDAIRRACGF